jgi:hypothetical protein
MACRTLPGLGRASNSCLKRIANLEHRPRRYTFRTCTLEDRCLSERLQLQAYRRRSCPLCSSRLPAAAPREPLRRPPPRCSSAAADLEEMARSSSRRLQREVVGRSFGSHPERQLGQHRHRAPLRSRLGADNPGLPLRLPHNTNGLRHGRTERPPSMQPGRSVHKVAARAPPTTVGAITLGTESQRFVHSSRLTSAEVLVRVEERGPSRFRGANRRTSEARGTFIRRSPRTLPRTQQLMTRGERAGMARDRILKGDGCG